MQWKKAIDAAREVAVTSKGGHGGGRHVGAPTTRKAEPDVPVTNTEVVRRKWILSPARGPITAGREDGS